MNSAPEFSQIQVFIVVAKHLSFVQASKILNVTPPAVTLAVSNLERRLSIRLFHRSTRSVSLTLEGEILLEKMLPIYENYLSAFEQFTTSEHEPKGRVKVSIPRIVQELFFAKIFLPFKTKYPEIHLEILVSDGFVNIVEEGFDFGIRFYESIPQDMIAIRFGREVVMRPFASPSFLERYGRPKSIDELSKFNCIQRKFPSGVYYAWEFFDGEKYINKRTNGSLSVNTDKMMIEAALNHLGIIYVYDSLVIDYEKNGLLEPILNQYQYPHEPFYLYYSSRENLSHASRCFIDWVKKISDATA